MPRSNPQSLPFTLIAPDCTSLASDANLQLKAHYGSVLKDWDALQKKERAANRTLSIPCFLKASPVYFNSHPKIVFVGQETHGWWDDYAGNRSLITAQEIADFYVGIWDFLQTYRSPYWTAIRQIVKDLNLESPPHSFVFSNIFPCDVDKKQAPRELHDDFRKWHVLPTELSILNPDYVIFLCGREYYGNLESYFGKMPDLFVSSATPLVNYQPIGVSWKGFVTYHPNYLRRSRKWNVLDQIVDQIRADIKRPTSS